LGFFVRRFSGIGIRDPVSRIWDFQFKVLRFGGERLRVEGAKIKGQGIKKTWCQGQEIGSLPEPGHLCLVQGSGFRFQVSGSRVYRVQGLGFYLSLDISASANAIAPFGELRLNISKQRIKIKSSQAGAHTLVDGRVEGIGTRSRVQRVKISCRISRQTVDELELRV
jgi:hypothetical protein